MKNEELYEKILREKGISIQVKTDLCHAEEEKFELSYQQKSIWFLQQMYPQSPLYNNPSAVLLNGNLDIDKLANTFNKLVERHQILNVGFKVEEGITYQYFRKTINFGFEVLDYITDGHVDSAERLKQYINTITKRPFDLLKDPVLRVYIIKLNEVKYAMIINIHHIVSDGWSKGIILRELASIYGEGIDIESDKLGKTKLQYNDYVRWMNQKNGCNEWKKYLKSWKERLKNSPALLELPADYERPSIQSNQGTMIEFSFSKDELEEIDLYCRESRCTLFSFLLSAFNLLLYRYSGQGDIVIGTPVAGRNNSKLEEMVGLFVNTVLIRTSIEDEMSFCEYLEVVKNEAYDSFSKQELPFDLLVAELNPQRELSYNPLFQIMFQLDNAPMPRTGIGDLELIPIVVDMGISQLDLSVTCWKEGDVLKGTFEYNTALFKTNRIERMISHYKNIIRDVIVNPKRRISQIPYLGRRERDELIYKRNETDYKLEDLPIIRMFEQHAEQLPSHIAVISNDLEITYKDLEEMACKIRNYLTGHGPENKMFVAICMESSVQLIAAVLAVLKCGRAFVPIDPLYPPDRIKTIIEDIDQPVILTDRVCAHLFENEDENVILTEEALNQSLAQVYDDCPKEGNTDNIICCIYTSGSTGKPKGVLIDNRSVLNLIHSFLLSYDVKMSDKLLPVTSISSASFVGEMLPILSAGGTLVLSNTDLFMDIQLIEEYIRKTGITLLSTVPSMVARLNKIEKFPESIRLILSGGEALYPSHIDQLENVQVVNGYGLTESGICSTYKVISRDDLKKEDYISVGRPIINNYIYILDKNLEVVPIGVAGEIYISGIGIALGYLHDEELTRQRFIENPFCEGYKMLKTGDVGCWLENGDLQHLGRVDNQVQVHGYRIELGEIQKELLNHDDLKDVFVMARRTKYDDTVLVAFYVTISGNSLKHTELSEWLAKRKPRYMVPGHFVKIDKIAFNLNGKVDISALEQVNCMKQSNVDEYEAAQTETERKIADIWMEYLEINEVSIYSNFFDLGGHSLLMSKILVELKERMTATLTIVELFKYPTIKTLGRYIDDNTQVSFRSTEDRAIMQRKTFAKQKRITFVNKKI